MAIISSTSSVSYNKDIVIVDPLTTTTATATIAYSVPFATNKAGYINVAFVANASTFATAIGGMVQGVFMRATGNISRTNSSDSLGLVSTLLSSFTVTQPKVTIVANTTTQSADITVTGVAATTIGWHLEITSYLSN